jgi:hypothetical protein
MATTVTASFAAVGVSDPVPAAPNSAFSLAISGTFVGTLVAEVSEGNGNWTPLASFTAAQAALGYTVPAGPTVFTLVRVRCSSLTSGIASVTLVSLSLASTPQTLTSPIIAGTPTGKIAYDPGQVAVNTLRIAANVASAETVTIGDDTFEIEILDTDSTDETADSSFDTLLPVTVLQTDYPNLPTEVGSLVLIDSEMLRLIATGLYLVFSRGASGTTVATHADATAIYIGDGVVSGNIPVGLEATLTPTAATPALVADVNSQGTEAVTMVQISVNEILLKADAVGAVTLACTETLAGANNGWNAAAMYGGKAQAVSLVNRQQRVPLAQEVTLGDMQFQFDFTPTIVLVAVAPTATPGAASAWDGSITISGGLVTLDNSGAVDWAATDTVTVLASA